MKNDIEKQVVTLLDVTSSAICKKNLAMPVMDFYESIYNITPAHADDVHAAIIENPDLEVITPAGGERRKANTIGVDDVIKMKKQISFFPMFLNAGTRGGPKE